MIIDDSKTNLYIAKTILEQKYEVLPMIDAERALNSIKKRLPDLILLDILMPKMNGFDVIKEISNSGAPYDSIPIIFLTSKSDDESEIVGFELGAVDYIKKPFSAPILLKRVALHLKFQEQNKQLLLQKQQLQEHSLKLEDYVNDLKNKNLLNDTMLECIETLVQEDSIELSMSKLLQIITDYYSAVSTKILYREKYSDILRPRFAYTNNKDLVHIPDQQFPIKNAIDLYEKFQVNGIAHIKSIEYVKDSPIFCKMFTDNQINTLLFVPLIHTDEIVGFLGVQNHTKNEDDVIMIKNITAFIVNHIVKYNLLNELEELSYNDTLTGVYNRNYYNYFIDNFDTRHNNSVGIIFGDINGLKVKNDKYGHEEGDKLIRDTAKFLKDNLDGLLFRIGGDEFVCIIENIGKDNFYNIINSIKAKVCNSTEINISIGASWSDSCNDINDINDIITTADQDMYKNKSDFYSNK